LPAVAAKMPVGNNAQISCINCPRHAEMARPLANGTPAARQRGPRATIAPSFLAR
jgi:hypothetical protein